MRKWLLQFPLSLSFSITIGRKNDIRNRTPFAIYTVTFPSQIHPSWWQFQNDFSNIYTVSSQRRVLRAAAISPAFTFLGSVKQCWYVIRMLCPHSWFKLGLGQCTFTHSIWPISLEKQPVFYEIDPMGWAWTQWLCMWLEELSQRLNLKHILSCYKIKLHILIHILIICKHIQYKW